VSLKMTQPEREEFLAGLHVGVLSVVDGDSAPLTIPVWYAYEPGGLVRLTTSGSSRKARAVGAAGRFSLCAQDERPPYKYVTVEGPAVISPAGLDERLEIARRYLGTEEGDAFVASDPGDGAESVMIRMTPERWLSADFGKLQG
jgi:PPOX class probable F420-dependent enzyme